jgi:hypothetical protein
MIILKIGGLEAGRLRAPAGRDAEPVLPR